MTYEFTIDGWLPGMNQWISAQNANRFKGAEMKKKAQTKCEKAIAKQLPGIQITKPIRLHYIWYERNRRRDHDNVSGFGHKVIQDALVKCGVLKDDGWSEIVGYTDCFSIDRDNPSIIVMLEEVDA